MTNNEKGHYIIQLIEVITLEIQEFPMRRKQLLLMRSHLEKAVRCTGTGKHRELNRPQSLPLVNHTKALPEEITEKVISVEPSAHIADNIPEVTKKNRRK